jgi:hypothetical protein
MASRVDNSTEFYSKALAGGDVIDTSLGMSFAGWFQINTDRNTYSSWVSLFVGGNYINIATESDGLAVWSFWNDSVGASNISLFTATANTWYFVAGSKATSGGDFTIYHGPAISGALSTSVNDVRGDWTGTTLEIGRDGAAGEWLNGTIGPLKIWTGVAMTANELNAERWQVAPVRLANLWAFYPFLVGDGSAAAEADYSVNARNLTGGAGSASVAGPPVPWRRGRNRYSLPTASGAPPTTNRRRRVLMGCR